MRIIGEKGELQAPAGHGMSHVLPDLQCVATFVWDNPGFWGEGRGRWRNREAQKSENIEAKVTQ